MKAFRYKPLSFKDLPLLHAWYTLPHVVKSYARRLFSFEELEEKYTPYILGGKGICGFICYMDGKPLGYIQHYPVKRYPWQGHELGEKLASCAGLDVFIGEKAFLGCGLGRLMIARFIQKHLKKYYTYCAVDPEVDNVRAIRCYEACGFSIHKKILSEDRREHYLMLKEHRVI